MCRTAAEIEVRERGEIERMLREMTGRMLRSTIDRDEVRSRRRR